MENLDHPELDFWVEKGLAHENITSWADELDISEDVIIQALKHAAFDIPRQEIKRKEEINAFNWFYVSVKKNKTYFCPVGYKSHEQIVLEKVKTEREERERLARALAEERQKAEAATRELKFQNILSNPTGDECMKLQERVKNRGGPAYKGKLLESVMREEFLKMEDPD